MKIKENATQEFIEMVKRAWVWERLTKEEKQRLVDSIETAKLFGTYDQRLRHLNDIFYAFLQGCGYKPIGWRE